MDVYTAEAQQIEEIKKWWRENGLSVVLGLTLGVSGIFGWRYWQDVNVESAEAASALYSDMIVSLQNENPTQARGSCRYDTGGIRKHHLRRICPDVARQAGRG